MGIGRRQIDLPGIDVRHSVGRGYEVSRAVAGNFKRYFFAGINKRIRVQFRQRKPLDRLVAVIVFAEAEYGSTFDYYAFSVLLFYLQFDVIRNSALYVVVVDGGSVRARIAVFVNNVFEEFIE